MQLKGRARDLAVSYLKQHSGCTFKQLRDYLEDVLERQYDSAAKLLFQTRTRTKDESILKFASALMTLVVAAYDANYSEKQMNEKVLEVFQTNLSGALGDKLRLNFPETLDKAIPLARNLESRGISEATPVNISTMSPLYIPQNPPDATGFTGKGKPRPFKPSNNTGYKGGFKPDAAESTKKCWHCNSTSHIKKDCWKLHGRPGGSGSTGGGGGGAGNMPPPLDDSRHSNSGRGGKGGSNYPGQRDNKPLNQK